MSDIDRMKEQSDALRLEFEQLSADLYAQMHEIKRISHESIKAFDHHVSLLKRCKDLEERLA